MYRLLLPSGKLVVVDRIVAMVEKSISMNGEKRNMLEVCRDLKFNPTALNLFQQVRKDNPFENTASSVLIGNLDTGYLKDILYRLLSQGYYSFADFQCQKADFFEKAVIDGGQSKPYIFENFFMPIFGGGGLPVGGIIDNSDNADEEAFACENALDNEDDEYDEYDYDE